MKQLRENANLILMKQLKMTFDKAGLNMMMLSVSIVQVKKVKRM